MIVLKVSVSMLVFAALVPKAMSLNVFTESIISCASPVTVVLICFMVVDFVTFGFSFWSKATLMNAYLC